MKKLIAPILAMAFALSALSADSAEETKEKENWIQIFNGKDLEGWTPKVCGYKLGENPGDIFRVVDGILTVSYDEYDKFTDQFGHLFYNEKLSHYRIRVEYRFVGEQCPGGPGWAVRNNGVMLHCQAPETMAEDLKFPISIEAQLLGGITEGKKRTTANLIGVGGNTAVCNGTRIKRTVKSTSDTFYGDQWVTFEAEVHGDEEIVHYINGKEVIRYSELQNIKGEALSEGYISIQAESGPTEFRKIELLVLEK